MTPRGGAGYDGASYDGALRHATAVLDALTPEQLDDIAAGRAQLVLRPLPAPRPARRPASPEPARPDVSADVRAINALASPVEVADYLRQHDVRLTLPILKQIARALGPTVPTTGRSKTQICRDIVAGTAGFRSRSAAMSGGAWA